jgi:hypothetical protein
MDTLTPLENHSRDVSENLATTARREMLVETMRLPNGGIALVDSDFVNQYMNTSVADRGRVLGGLLSGNVTYGGGISPRAPTPDTSREIPEVDIETRILDRINNYDPDYNPPGVRTHIHYPNSRETSSIYSTGGSIRHTERSSSTPGSNEFSPLDGAILAWIKKNLRLSIEVDAYEVSSRLIRVESTIVLKTATGEEISSDSSFTEVEISNDNDQT